MKKQNLLLIGALAVGGYFAWKKGLFGGSGSTEEGEETTPGEEETETGTKKSIDTVLDTRTSGLSIPQAIEQAKSLTKEVKDIAVLIKTPKGTSDIVVASGSKKASRKLKRSTRRDNRLRKKYLKTSQANCDKFKSKSRKKRCSIAKSQALSWLAQHK